jgi:SAM-dependent methyltransferase
MTIAPLRDVSAGSGWPDSVLGPPSVAAPPVTLVTECGRSIPVDVARWHSPASEADRTVVERCEGPVLDIGSGPGRIVRAIAAEGLSVLGVDVSSVAVDHALAAGSPCVLVDVFGDVPGAGTWRSALLLDGNSGIGGDPVRLLRRVAELVSGGGSVVVEVEPMHRGGTPTRRVQVVHGDDLSAWFSWAVVSVDELPGYAAASGWMVDETWTCGDRWFTRLVRGRVSS